MNDLNHFTIVSITYNNEGINNTIKSVLSILDAGGKMIIQNGGSHLYIENKNIKVFNEKDNGIYDALNKGISKVRTEFFMILHAGDTFIGKAHYISDIIEEMEKSSKSMSLNSQFIGSRLHSSRNWRPWMLNLGVQPPHLPVIYKSRIFTELTYSLDIPIIADFDFFLKNVQWQNVSWSNKLLVRMETGGATSGGIRSFLLVSLCFIKTYHLRGLLMAVSRIPFKIIQSLY